MQINKKEKNAKQLPILLSTPMTCSISYVLITLRKPLKYIKVERQISLAVAFI